MFQNLETVHEKVRPTISTFFQKVVEDFGERVDSIYLYGNVTTKDFVVGKSYINSLVLFDDFSFDAAEQMHPHVKPVLKKNIAAPLCLSVETFLRSADTFPLELIEIKDTNIQLFGELNRMDELDIPLEFLRVKIEEQIKGKLIRLREVYMENGDKPRHLLTILVQVQEDLFPVYRNVLRFFEVESPPIEHREILKQLEERTEFSTRVCRNVWDHAMGNQSIPRSQAKETFGDYVDLLLKLSHIVDKWDEDE